MAEELLKGSNLRKKNDYMSNQKPGQGSSNQSLLVDSATTAAYTNVQNTTSPNLNPATRFEF